MAKRQRSTPPTSSPSVSSSSEEEEEEEEESPPPAISPMKKSSFVTATGKPSTRQLSTSDSSEDEEEVDERSNQEDSSEDSGHVDVKVNPPTRPQDSRNTDVGKTLVTASTSDSSTEDGEEEDSDSDKAPPPQIQARPNAEGQKTKSPVDGLGAVADEDDDGSEFSSSSDGTTNPPLSPSRNYAEASSKQPDSNPMGSHVQTADSSPMGKRSASSLVSVSEKKQRTNGVVGSDADQKKNDFFKRVWSNDDELALLQGVLDYKERHHAIPSLKQMESLLNSLKGSLSISASVNQMSDKIRRLKQKYANAVKRVGTAKNPNILNAHDAAVFDLSGKIWGSSQEESVALKNDVKPEKFRNIRRENGKGRHLSEECPSLNQFINSGHENMVPGFDLSRKIRDSSQVESVSLKNDKPEKFKNIKRENGKGRHFPEECSSLNQFINSELGNMISVLPVSHIPMPKAKQFDGMARNMEITQFQLHLRKHKLVGNALKMVQNALAEC